MTEIPCAICGEAAILQPKDMHHTIPRGRGGHDSPLAPVCRRCHDLCEPEGSWRVTPQDGMWVTLDVTSGEEVCRRPVEPRAIDAVAEIQHVTDLLDPRGEKERLRAFLAYRSDSELQVLNAVASRQQRVSAAFRALVRYEAYLRYPFKLAPNWADVVGEAFGVAANTMRQDVQAAALWELDSEPAMDWSWYRTLCHASGAVELLEEVKEKIWAQGAGTIADLRAFLGLVKREMHLCPECGGLHAIKEATPS